MLSSLTPAPHLFLPQCHRLRMSRLRDMNLHLVKSTQVYLFRVIREPCFLSQPKLFLAVVNTLVSSASCERASEDVRRCFS